MPLDGEAALRHTTGDRRAIGEGELGGPLGCESKPAPETLGQHREHRPGIDQEARLHWSAATPGPRDPGADVRETHGRRWYHAQANGPRGQAGKMGAPIPSALTRSRSRLTGRSVESARRWGRRASACAWSISRTARRQSCNPIGGLPEIRLAGPQRSLRPSTAFAACRMASVSSAEGSHREHRDRPQTGPLCCLSSEGHQPDDVSACPDVGFVGPQRGDGWAARGSWSRTPIIITY